MSLQLDQTFIYFLLFLIKELKGSHRFQSLVIVTFTYKYYNIVEIEIKWH